MRDTNLVRLWIERHNMAVRVSFMFGADSLEAEEAKAEMNKAARNIVEAHGKRYAQGLFDMWNTMGEKGNATFFEINVE